MADKTISVTELLTMAKEGAIIKTEDRPTKIAKFDELLSKIDSLIKATELRARAELERAQVQLEVIAGLQALIRKSDGKAPVDLTPLKTALTELQRPQQPRQAFEFAIDRAPNGFMTKIVATPIAPTKH